jgi:hypothetical protein
MEIPTRVFRFYDHQAALYPKMEEIATKITEYLGGSVEGYDTEGHEYATLMEMWDREGLAAEKLPVQLKSNGPAAEPAAEAEATRVTRAAGNQSQIKTGQRQAQKWYTDAFNYWEVSVVQSQGCTLACRFALQPLAEIYLGWFTGREELPSHSRWRARRIWQSDRDGRGWIVGLYRQATGEDACTREGSGSW